jgi:NAD(P)H-hydrate epimerase
MQPILTAEQIRGLDAYTIANEPVPSIALMERACKAFVKWFAEKFDKNQLIGIACGTGNNGGDGLGIARLLLAKNYKVKVWVLRGSMKASDDFTKNFKRLPKKIKPVDITSSVSGSLFDGCDVVVDAIFGTGLSRPAEGVYKEMITAMNAAKAVRVAVDLPSGMMADAESKGDIVKAHYTVSFQFPRMAFLLPQSGKDAGDWHVIDIGLMKAGIPNVSSFLVKEVDIVPRFIQRDKFSHKGDHGKALVIAGSYGKMGAAVLSAAACLRSGVGLLTVHVPGKGYDIIQTSVPEAMATVDASSEIFSRVPNVSSFDAIGIGPGIGTSPETATAFRQLLEQGKPMVIDADALNILSQDRSLLHLVPRGSILTPHPGEFERLAGKSKNDFDRLNLVRKLSIDMQSVIVLKGAHTCVANSDGNIYFNSTGNPGMATGGSGDVLAGMLTALMAGGYTAFDAALVGVFAHGLAGDLASAAGGQVGMVAGDIVKYLPKAWHTLNGKGTLTPAEGAQSLSAAKIARTSAIRSAVMPVLCFFN